MNNTEKSDLELFEQARKRVQKKNLGRCVRNKDVIVDQEKEIIYYRDKIRRLTEYIEREAKEKEESFEKEIELTIKEEEYLIKYNSITDAVLITMCINKIINEPKIDRIYKHNEFRIYNKTRLIKHADRYADVERIKRLWHDQ